MMIIIIIVLMYYLCLWTFQVFHHIFQSFTHYEDYKQHFLPIYIILRCKECLEDYPTFPRVSQHVILLFTLQRMSRGLSNISKGIPTCKNPKHFPHAASLLVLIISFVSSTFPCVTYINLNKKISM